LVGGGTLDFEVFEASGVLGFLVVAMVLSLHSSMVLAALIKRLKTSSLLQLRWLLLSYQYLLILQLYLLLLILLRSFLVLLPYTYLRQLQLRRVQILTIMLSDKRLTRSSQLYLA
jgi:Na+/H+-dicarboxylate symporter